MALKRKTKWLWQVLILSMGLNVLFLFLFYSAIFQKDIYKLRLFSGPLIAKSSQGIHIPEDFLETLSQASLNELLLSLKDESFVYGRPVKFWALSVAITVHHVDITPVLPHPLTFTELKSPSRIWFLPNIDNREFPAICHYLSTHRYPYTSQGLFLRISRSLAEGQVDEDCLYSFCLTPEFLYFRTLLAGAELEVASVASLARMVIEEGAELFFSLCNEEARHSAISDRQRQKVLRAYLDREVALAALLLLVHDSDAVLHEFCNEDVQKILHLLPSGSPYRERFLARLVNSPRKECSRPVYPEKKELEEVLEQEYVIQEGDSLWLIAQRFHISVEKLKEKNQLKNDRLLPGRVLRLPPKSS
ncbi:LysM peptidoglycan-binding domain-containing protein [Candidatus Chlamydia sanziniae]|uniref:LysM domain-containing protein n=1 Tax=Candidatus Chlamydia sanziniae TaxID=1806891 RepID=A0A1A9HWB4_9CHLA|nr:LysM peptidoglycan-binding domain-containing protein [Candidatus Chlamydia sanziniae]ANH78393.1 hypothetical protein Cs308_0222 [Candidatus Chlamydia sanziniae]